MSPQKLFFCNGILYQSRFKIISATNQKNYTHVNEKMKLFYVKAK